MVPVISLLDYSSTVAEPGINRRQCQILMSARWICPVTPGANECRSNPTACVAAYCYTVCSVRTHWQPGCCSIRHALALFVLIWLRSYTSTLIGSGAVSGQRTAPALGLDHTKTASMSCHPRCDKADLWACGPTLRAQCCIRCLQRYCGHGNAVGTAAGGYGTLEVRASSTDT